jgi:hypothetical protein
LIHQKTVLELSQIIAKQAWETTFNAATPYHPSETYYTQKAIDFGLTPPTLIIANLRLKPSLLIK